MAMWRNKKASLVRMSRVAARLLMTTILFGSASVPTCRAEEPAHTGKVIWEADFSDPDLPEWTTGYSSPTDGEKGKRTMEVKDGNLILASTFPEPPDNRGGASFTYHFSGDFSGDERLGFRVSEAPVLEWRMRRKGGRLHAMSIFYQTFAGERGSMGVSLTPHYVGAEWFESRVDLYADPEIAGPASMQYLQDLRILMFSDAPAGEAVSGEVDWIRLREMTPAEWESANRYLEPLREFEMQPCPRAENFFGLGFYGIWPSRWGGGYELTLDHMARRWVNFMLPIGARFGDVMRSRYDPGKSLQENLAVSDLWLNELLDEENLGLLKPYGMKYLANMEEWTGQKRGGTVEEMNREQLVVWADAVTSALKDDESILGWYIADEAGPAYLKKYLVAKELLESRDRSKTAAVLLPSGSVSSLKTFAPHHQVMVTDMYPVMRPGDDDPWKITWWMDEARKASGDKPHWIVLQAFRRPHSQTLGTKATDIELRMMSWLAAAGGADAVTYFLYSGNPWWHHHYIQKKGGLPFWCMVDEYGNPLDLWQAYAEFADKVGPLADLITRAPVIEHHGLEANAPTITLKTLNDVRIQGARTRPAIYLGVLCPQGMDALVVFAVNIDRENPHEVCITGKPKTLAGRQLYDLVSLQPVKREEGVFAFGTLLPGGGHPFALATEAEFALIQRNVVTSRARQALRVAGLDMAKAERWGIDVASMHRILEEAQRTLQHDPSVALTKAEGLSRHAQSELQKHPVYSQAAPLIERAQRKLGDIEILLNLAVQKKLPIDRVEPTAKRVLKLSERFSGLKRKLYFGEGEVWVDDARELVPQVEQALADVKEVTGLTVVPEPIFPERPWRHPEWFE